MRNTNILKTITLSVVLLPFVIIAGHSHASQQPRGGPLPEALEATVNSKQRLIEQDLAGRPQSEWAGNYYLQDGPTAGTQLSWSPAAGFVVKWSTCSHGWRERVNYGSVTFQNGVLRLVPELLGTGVNEYPISSDIVPVMWGEQHYLIPVNQLINFSYAVKNVGNSPEIEAFFIKEGDSEKPRKGLPNVPPEYRKYLHSKPVVAVISEVKPKTQTSAQDFTLNVGQADGVVAGMKFYALSPKNIYMLVEVTETREHTSTAYVIMSGYKNRSEKELKPRVGWKLTSRAPKGAWHYYPG